MPEEPRSADAPAIGITGANGYIGRALTDEALRRGFEVRTFTRRAWVGAPHVPLAERRTLVLPAPPAIEDLAGLDAVINLAVAARGSSEAVSRAINVHGTRVLADALGIAGVPRFVHVSTQSAHEGALNRYGRTKWQAEQVLADRAGTVIVRPGLVDDGGSGNGLLDRSARAAARLRTFPVMAGTTVQLVRMEELVDVLLRLADVRAFADAPALVELGHPTPCSLGDVVAATAEARFGVRPKIVTIPMSPVRFAARVGRAVPLAAPVADVVDGVIGSRTMDNASALTALGIELAPFDPAPRARPESPEGEEARRLMVVGAGRIGSLHAMIGGQHPDAVLSALVDPDPLAGLRTAAASGTWVPHHRSMAKARAAGHLGGAAIVSSPPATHLAAAAELLDAGLDVLIEKPAAPDPDSRAELVSRAAAAVGAASVGYQLVQLPHVRAASERLVDGAFGEPTGFAASAWVARSGSVEGTLTWELDPAQHGGVLSQIPSHVLSLVDLLLGPLEVRRAASARVAGRQVEDAAWVELAAGSIMGTLVCGWHRPEFVVPDNSVRIATTFGQLVVTMASAAFIPSDGTTPWVQGALVGSTGFDPAPLDGAAGYWLEHRLLLAGRTDGNGLDLAERIEAVVDSARSAATPPMPLVDVAVGTPVAPSRARVVTTPPGAAEVLIDIRRVGVDALGARPEVRVVCSVDDVAALEGADPLVVVPDGPSAFRALTNEGPLALIRDRGLGRLAAGALRCDPRYSFEPAGVMWEAIGTLLRAELSVLPRTFTGQVALDGYLVDLAGSIGRLEQLARMVRTIRRRLPHARIGVETNAPHLAARVLAVVVDDIDFILTVGDPAMDVAADVRALLARELEVIVKTGSQPWEVVDLAEADPAPWTGSGSALVLDGRGAAACRASTAELYRTAVASTGCPPDEVDGVLGAMGLGTTMPS